jgi:hypothetical protein
MRYSVQLVKGPVSAVKHLQLPLEPDFQADLCQSWGQIPVSQAQHLLKKNNSIVRFLAIFFFPGSNTANHEVNIEQPLSLNIQF